MLRVTPCAILASWVLASCLSLAAQDPPASIRSSNVPQNTQAAVRTKARQTVSADDGLSILAAALDSKARLHSANDCSHLAHAVYERAGFPYAYASSSDLYDGVHDFERVQQPQPGDLIAWRGHVGIVVKPSRHIFFSFLRSGPGTEDWTSSYWKTRGRPRFYRYVQNRAHPGAKFRSATGRGLSK